MFNGKIHYKWPFSIAMLVYQRVPKNGWLIVDDGSSLWAAEWSPGPKKLHSESQTTDRFHHSQHLSLRRNFSKQAWNILKGNQQLQQLQQRVISQRKYVDVHHSPTSNGSAQHPAPSSQVFGLHSPSAQPRSACRLSKSPVRLENVFV